MPRITETCCVSLTAPPLVLGIPNAAKLQRIKTLSKKGVFLIPADI